jgi:2-polyprenyl-3-methyl-5-hydroxy-6-metoxy-1,4-benzoquinol methylase
MDASPSTPSMASQVAFYDDYWKDLKPFGDYKLQRVLRILEHLRHLRRSIKNPRILDLGCGDGRSVAVWDLAGTASGFDLSEGAMKAAQMRYPSLDFKFGNACESVYGASSFDIVISQEVIEHIIDQRAYLEQCHHMLAPGGYLILTTPNKYYFDRVKGGNYSRQPIENLLYPNALKALVEQGFVLQQFYSMIYAGGHYGVYRWLTHPRWMSVLRKMGWKPRYERWLGKRLLLLNLVVVARKK